MTSASWVRFALTIQSFERRAASSMAQIRLVTFLSVAALVMQQGSPPARPTPCMPSCSSEAPRERRRSRCCALSHPRLGRCRKTVLRLPQECSNHSQRAKPSTFFPTAGSQSRDSTRTVWTGVRSTVASYVGRRFPTGSASSQRWIGGPFERPTLQDRGVRRFLMWRIFRSSFRPSSTGHPGIRPCSQRLVDEWSYDGRWPAQYRRITTTSLIECGDSSAPWSFASGSGLRGSEKTASTSYRVTTMMSNAFGDITGHDGAADSRAPTSHLTASVILRWLCEGESQS